MSAQANNSVDERLQILKLVEEGKLSASEAAQLLGSMSRGMPAQKAPEAPVEPIFEIPSEQDAVEQPISISQAPSPEGPKWLRIRVTDMATGRSKVRVNLPIGMVDWGLKIGARYAPEVSDFDFQELSQILKTGAGGKLIDVMDDEDGEHVEIFVD